ncbi:MAG: hypothetical protein A2W92_13160 [Bacteroidetes bacterium GWA2_42_15]|nr:MAG: hypothetical protein A2W92_13160 [Bacteroidetes bacterium GWA2_42_15]
MFRSDIIADKIYILCAAIWFKDGKIYKYQPKNVDNGFVVCGRRHSNCYTTAWIVNKGETEYLLETNDRVIEGFLTSDDQFVDRKKGGEIAFSAKQTKILKSCLLAEDLY